MGAPTTASPESEASCADTLAITLANGRRVVIPGGDRPGPSGAAASGPGRHMIALPPSVKVYLARGATDMMGWTPPLVGRRADSRRSDGRGYREANALRGRLAEFALVSVNSAPRESAPDGGRGKRRRVAGGVADLLRMIAVEIRGCDRSIAELDKKPAATDSNGWRIASFTRDAGRLTCHRRCDFRAPDGPRFL